MAQIAVDPFILEDCLLKIDAHNFEMHVSNVLINPRSTVQWRGLTPNARYSRSLWQARLDYAQDWTTVNSLSRFLHDHEGEVVDAEFHPQAGGLGFSVKLAIAAGGIGGQVEQVATGSVTLEVSAKPEYIETP